MSELLGKPFPEIGGAEHDKITRLIEKLDPTEETLDHASYIFDKEDFGGLLLIDGLERITVETGDESVNVRVRHVADGNKQQIDAYEYDVNRRCLILNQMMREYTEEYETLENSLAELQKKISQVQQLVNRSYASMEKGIRQLSEKSEYIAQMFATYDEQQATIAADYATDGESDDLTLRMLENEATMYDLFEYVASESPECERLLGSFRKALHMGELLHTQLISLQAQLATYDYSTVTGVANSGVFVRLLETVARLSIQK
jgi:hypothetical protein